MRRRRTCADAGATPGFVQDDNSQ